MTDSYALSPAQLFTGTDPASLPFKTTDELDSLKEVIGQQRAIAAIELGIEVNKSGFNLFALGPAGIGKQSTIMQYLEKRAESQPTPDDWCYVNNFENPQKPHALRLPAGKGHELYLDMQKLVDDTKTSMPVAFESENYQKKLQQIQEKYEQQRAKIFNELSEEAAEKHIALIRGPNGFLLAPIVNGKAIDNKEFSKLPEQEQQRINTLIEKYENRLSSMLQKMPQLAREERTEIRKLVRETATQTVDGLVASLLDKYQQLPEVCQYLMNVKNDIADSVDDFIEQQATPELLELARGEAPLFRKYEVNVLIDNKETTGAPIVYEDNPAYPKLTGRIEHESRMGTLVTDFTHIKPGALHTANGGYLLLDVLELLRQPFAWDALKRILYANKISIQSIGTLYGMMDTTSLEPEPVPLDIKIVLMGERYLYYLLLQYDPGFKELFKIAADFEEEMDRTSENIEQFSRLLAYQIKKEDLPPFSNSAVARLVDHSSRLASDAERLSTHLHSIVDLLQEAGHWAIKMGEQPVSAASVQRAIDEQVYRVSRLKEKLGSEIQRETIVIETEGDLVGSINGLAVIDLGNFRFAYPTRITATTRLGNGKVIDIEREAKLGGATHSKGVLILSSFLASRYCKDSPLSLTASLTFEQSYGHVEGDSASMAELCALLSSLAGIPIHQSLAITGSVNQLGKSQAIGGVNEKIEGFFDICKERGLSGQQGVIIPVSNVKHLMLNEDVVSAVNEGKFQVYAVADVDQAIEVLTGLPAGQRDQDGSFPEGSINRLVEQRLIEMSEKLRKFAQHKGEETD
jgi:lon-related putative ATP-dependent protease